MNHDFLHTAIKIKNRVKTITPLVYRKKIDLAEFKYKKLNDCKKTNLIDANINDDNWGKLAYNELWGEKDLHFVLRNHFQVPKDFGKNVVLYLPIANQQHQLEPETLLYINGKAVAGNDGNHKEILLPKNYCDNKEHTIALAGWTCCPDFDDIRGHQKMFMARCALAEIDLATRELVTMANVTLDTIEVIKDNMPQKQRLLTALNEAFKLLNLMKPFDDKFYDSVPKALQSLKDGIKKAGQSMDVNLTAIGHSHIDVAWLWTLDHTKAKCARTFNTTCHLMDQYKDYKFTQSQPQLYDYVKKDYPELFEKIKKLIKEGRWEPIGGMWVEADCNLSGAEALARQFLLGRQFFAENFGENAETPILFLPDVFGYAYNLPQLIKQADMEYFFTTKIGWNQYNKFPYTTFWWQGLDGTKILTHLGTTQNDEEETKNDFITYNGNGSVWSFYTSWDNAKQKDLHDEVMTTYGFGDGGGGTTKEMIERVKLLKDFPAMPKTKMGTTREFFKKLDEKHGNEFPTHNGELYLELHRGTYTTHAKNKKANRQSEFKIHDAEFLASLATLTDKNYLYPQKQIDETWKLICLNQFHDIIPGSSINEVYVESLKQYEQIGNTLKAIQKEATDAICKNIAAEVIIINPTSFKRTDIGVLNTILKNDETLAVKGKTLLTQSAENKTLVAVENVEPFSVTTAEITKQTEKIQNNLKVTPNLLENELISVKLDNNGDIVGIYDKKNQRQVLAENSIANEFQAFEDRPNEYDAWEIDVFFEDKKYLAKPASSIKVVETGPVRATIEIKRTILNSEYTQRISIRHNSCQIDFDTNINWKENATLLKVAFPVNILSPVATYEIQWGNVQRATHRNTSIEWAQFEMCAQKWADLSENDYGVSILNDCKYGHDIKDNLMRLSLLRSSSSPDKTADRGTHSFKYSLLPHKAKLNETIKQAYYLNDDLIITTGGNCEKENEINATKGMIKTNRDNVIIETIKKAQDGNGFIVRLYEAMRQRSEVTIKTGFKIGKCSLSNIVERDCGKIKAEKNEITMQIKPFQIVTLRIVPA